MLQLTCYIQLMISLIVSIYIFGHIHIDLLWLLMILHRFMANMLQQKMKILNDLCMFDGSHDI